MSHAAYPTATDLRDELISAALFSNPPTAAQLLIDLDSAIGGAIETFEDRCGYAPFLADTIDSTWYFYPDGSPILDLQGGFVSITSVSVNGNAVTLNTDYRTMPANALTRTRPITYLKFDSYYGRIISLYTALPGQAAPVSVTGKRGAFVAIPDVAWNAMLALGILAVIASIDGLLRNGVIKSWKSGTTEEEYTDKAFATRIVAWQSDIDAALSPSSRCRRTRIA